ncbi:DUF3368 domain-containing protein [Chlorobium limicola]|uniref:DUF3368 domain-containing protein n=1 Tax=Chlorobium limicola TaxID=1092 RepID=UPI000AA6801B|nr:DUF3368 domain-containing protein [Chlorobium limicola]
MRAVAEAEKVETMGTIRVLEQLVRNAIIDAQHALDSLEKMKQSGRRLPWNDADRILRALL